MHTHTHIFIFFHILFHYGLSQAIDYNSLCYTIGPCCLSLLLLLFSRSLMSNPW